MYENLLRPHEVQHLPAPLPLSHIVDKLKKMEQNREEKRLRQIANASKRKREDDLEGLEADKRARTEESSALEDNNDQDGSKFQATPLASANVGLATGSSQVDATPAKVNLAKASPEVRGHTSYLTFARLVPISNPTTENIEVDAVATSS